MNQKGIEKKLEMRKEIYFNIKNIDSKMLLQYNYKIK